MKKRIILGAIVILSVISLISCKPDDPTKSDVKRALEKEEIVDDDMEYELEIDEIEVDDESAVVTCFVKTKENELSISKEYEVKFSLTDDKTWKRKRVKEKEIKIELVEEISEKEIEKIFEDYKFEVDKYTFSGDYVEICSLEHNVDKENLKDELKIGLISNESQVAYYYEGTIVFSIDEEKLEWEIEEYDLNSSNNYLIDRDDYYQIPVDTDIATITEEELEEYIASDLEANEKRVEIYDGVLEEGMVVNLDYVGTVEGEIYAQKTEAELILSSDQFAIDGFIDGLIGKSVGQEVILNLQFPDDYPEEEYAGKNIEFNVTINAIVNIIIPELTDDYVKEVYSYLGISTVEEYKEEYRNTIRTQEIYNAVWLDLVGNIDFVAYDRKQVEALYESELESQLYAFSNYGMTLESYLEATDQTEEGFYAEIYYMVIDEMQNEIVVEHIAKEENLSVTEEEYQKELKKTMIVYDIETEEEFYETFESYGYDKDFFMKNFIKNKVVEFICDNVVVE